jgi:DnaJ-domain-containing protein 1
MNEEQNLPPAHVGIAVLGIMCIITAFIVLIQRQSHTKELRTEKERGAAAAAKAEQLRSEADSLLLEVWARDSAMIQQHLLSLKLIHQMDSIHESYQSFVPVLARAGRNELRILSDSILAGFDRNRARYLVLLHRRSPADARGDSLGAGGL